MSQDEVNEQFRALVFADAIQETDQVVRQILTSEAQARHAMACEGDPVAAQEFANAGYQVLLGVPMRSVPSVVMSMADMFNREHEAYTVALDYILDIEEHLRQFQTFWERGDTAAALASVAAIQAIVKQAVDDAIYERSEDSE